MTQVAQAAPSLLATPADHFLQVAPSAPAALADLSAPVNQVTLASRVRLENLGAPVLLGGRGGLVRLVGRVAAVGLEAGEGWAAGVGPVAGVGPAAREVWGCLWAAEDFRTRPRNGGRTCVRTCRAFRTCRICLACVGQSKLRRALLHAPATKGQKGSKRDAGHRGEVNGTEQVQTHPQHTVVQIMIAS